jgi:selenocysteine-specific translation elongation factor
MNQNILFYGNEEALNEVAKKGSETDIRYYNSKIEGSEITFLSPFKFPERIQTLLNAISISNKAIIAVDQIDRSVGEFILSLYYYDIKNLGVIGDESTLSRIRNVTKGTWIEVIPLKPTYEDFLHFISIPTAAPRNRTIVVVDQTFPVKGVGTVSLGFVMGGIIKKHMQMKSYPSGKNVEIKSIQMQDVDVESSGPFSRVGLAFRNSEVDDVPKGSILFENEELQFTENLRLNVNINPAVKSRPSVGEKIQINFLFNNLNAEISDISENSYLIDVSRKVPLIDEIFSLSSLNSNPRIIGAGKPEH